ncbi:MAG: type II toxin-antitoxin system VapC family toxin [Gemmataceae bacterium]
MRGRFNAITTAADGAAVLTLYELLRRTEAALEPFRVLPVSRAVADRFDELLKNKKLKKAGRPDLLIACIALAHDATLVTRNTKDYAGIPNLRIENWAE